MNFSRLVGGLALGATLLVPGMASAAWNNVFQLTCCGSAPRTSARIAASPCCPPPPCCPQTAYVQRSYYQPVQTYKPVATYEPVTSYRTSYYYEPVATVSYSLYVDPCTGCSQQVATPATSYQLRSKCDAVTSYVQRISYQPVTAYRQSFYFEPVQVNVSAYAPVYTAPIVSAPPVTIQAPPATYENTLPPSSPPPPLNLPQDNRSMPPTTTEKSAFPSTSVPRPMPANFIPERIASLGGSPVIGTVVKSDFAPQANARIRFVNSDGQLTQPVTADATGTFSVTLTSGQWKIYTEDATGRPIYHSDIQVRGESRNVMVVSR